MASETQDLQQLLNQIANYENQIQLSKEKEANNEKILQEKDQQINELKNKVALLEQQLCDAEKLKQQRSKESEEVENLKMRSEDTLTRAKSIIFENTKVIKNQELQIEALNQQIESLKDVVSITKDLLEIRNLEIKQLETKLTCMEGRQKAEKERFDLTHKKLETMIRFNGELKREYETQLCLFTALRERYSEKELAKGVLEELRNGAVNGSASTEEAPSTSGTTMSTPDASQEVPPTTNGLPPTNNEENTG